MFIPKNYREIVRQLLMNQESTQHYFNEREFNRLLLQNGIKYTESIRAEMKEQFPEMLAQSPEITPMQARLDQLALYANQIQYYYTATAMINATTEIPSGSTDFIAQQARYEIYDIDGCRWTDDITQEALRQLTLEDLTPIDEGPRFLEGLFKLIQQASQLGFSIAAYWLCYKDSYEVKQPEILKYYVDRSLVKKDLSFEPITAFEPVAITDHQFSYTTPEFQAPILTQIKAEESVDDNCYYFEIKNAEGNLICFDVTIENLGAILFGLIHQIDVALLEKAYLENQPADLPMMYSTYRYDRFIQSEVLPIKTLSDLQTVPTTLFHNTTPIGRRGIYYVCTAKFLDRYGKPLGRRAFSEAVAQRDSEVRQVNSNAFESAIFAALKTALAGTHLTVHCAKRKKILVDGVPNIDLALEHDSAKPQLSPIERQVGQCLKRPVTTVYSLYSDQQPIPGLVERPFNELVAGIEAVRDHYLR